MAIILNFIYVNYNKSTLVYVFIFLFLFFRYECVTFWILVCFFGRLLDIFGIFFLCTFVFFICIFDFYFRWLLICIYFCFCKIDFFIKSMKLWWKRFFFIKFIKKFFFCIWRGKKNKFLIYDIFFVENFLDFIF